MRMSAVAMNNFIKLKLILNFENLAQIVKYFQHIYVLLNNF